MLPVNHLAGLPVVEVTLLCYTKCTQWKKRPMTVETPEFTVIHFYKSSDLVCNAVGIFSNSKINLELFYSCSKNYALAVIEFGQAVKANWALNSAQSSAR
jgi:hypothetical protein